jgi:cytochrome c peroxidase
MLRARIPRLTLFASLAVLLAGTGCDKSKDKSKSSDKQAKKSDQEDETAKGKEGESDRATLVNKARSNLGPFEALPDQFESEENPITEEKVKLGRMLYYEDRISKDNDVSCNTCHPLEDFGVDGKKVSRGHEDRKGPRNAPTVYNAANQIAQFWDGRAADVEEQAKGPVLNPKEMAMPGKEQVEKFLASVPGYQKKFKKAFPDAEDPVSFDNMAKAIGAFERKLVTPSKWDAFIEGDDEALTKKELKGFNTFVEAGCPTCHVGSRVGGTMYQKLGLVKEYPDKSDKGRYKVTKKESDKMKFKVPVLRNVTETGPYFHDGEVETLEKAVRLMGKHQLGRDLSDKQVDLIITWLETLDGEIPKDYIEKPELPKTG